MADIRHRVGITAPRRVYHALATTEGLSGWWTRDTAGTRPGGKLEFYFGQPEPAAVMEVTELIPASGWPGAACRDPTSGSVPPSPSTCPTPDGETALLFTHADWREPIEFMHHCSTKWAYYLLGLKAGLEGGVATPYPEDMAISSWG